MNPVNRPAALLLALSAAAAGCGTDLRPQYRVTDLRILGVRAEVVGGTSADVAPGDGVRLAALVANPLARAGLSVRWYACAPSATDALPPCLDQELLKDPAALAATPGVVLLGEAPIAAGDDEAAIEVPVPDAAGALDAAIRLAREQPTYQCRLYADVPIVVVAEAEGRREVAVKRVRLTPRPADLEPYPELQGAYVLNLNPAVRDLVRAPAFEDGCVGGMPLAGEPFPPGRTVLCGTADAPGSYNVCGPAGERTLVGESRSWQWFVTAGEFPEFDGLGNAVDAAPEFERPAGPFTLWVVLRDGRGGESWARRDVGAAP